MPTLPLSPKLCSLIASFLTPSPPTPTLSSSNSSSNSTRTLSALTDLLALCLTCKTFQRAAEPLLYRTVVLSEPPRVLAFASTVLENDSLAAHVKTFAFVQPPAARSGGAEGPGQLHKLDLGQDFWTVIHRIMDAIQWTVEVLVLSDSSARNTFIFVPPGHRPAPRVSSHTSLSSTVSISTPSESPTSQPPRGEYWSFPALHTLKLRFPWDVKAAAFISGLSSPSSKMKTLHFYDTAYLLTTPSSSAPSPHQPELEFEFEPGHLPPSCIPPNLSTYDGSLTTLLQFLPAPPPPPSLPALPALPSTHPPPRPRSTLSHLQIVLDTPEPPQALKIIQANFRILSSSLRALSMLDVPDELVDGLLGVLSHVLPTLTHLGLLPYPQLGRHRFHMHLMALHDLRTVEVDLSRWRPVPSHPAVQKAVAAELHTFCPSLSVVVLWIGSLRAEWTWNCGGTPAVAAAAAPAAGAATPLALVANATPNQDGSRAAHSSPSGYASSYQRKHEHDQRDVSAPYGGPMGAWSHVVDGHRNPQYSTTWCEA